MLVFFPRSAGIAFLLLAAAALAEQQPRALRVPSKHFKGERFSGAAEVLNRHLLGKANEISVERCDAIDREQLDEIVEILEAAKDAALRETYLRRGDRRARVDEPVESTEWDEDPVLARERRCTHAVLLYVHHLSESTRVEVAAALPLLPLLPTMKRHAWAEGDVHRRYLQTTDAIECHLEVSSGGCPGGTIDRCVSSCPADSEQEVLFDRCVESCSSLCGENATVPSPPLVQPEAPQWGTSWQVIISRNSTNADGTDAGFRACTRWYDWSIFSMRTDCTRNGVTSTSLHVGGFLWQINMASQSCFRSPLGVTPVAPDWLSAGTPATYLGKSVVNDIPVNMWDKPEPLGDGGQGNSHIYSVALSDQRPVQMLTTGPTGEKNQKEYLSYLLVDIDPEIFAVPSFCRAAKTVSLEDLTEHASIIVTDP